MRDFFLLLAWFVDTLVILKIKSQSFVLAGAPGLVFGFVYCLHKGLVMQSVGMSG